MVVKGARWSKVRGCKISHSLCARPAGTAVKMVKMVKMVNEWPADPWPRFQTVRNDGSSRSLARVGRVLVKCRRNGQTMPVAGSSPAVGAGHTRTIIYIYTYIYRAARCGRWPGRASRRGRERSGPSRRRTRAGSGSLRSNNGQIRVK
jgi:hypothetical protein